MSDEDELNTLTASGRFRKMEKDLYFGNGKPGICTRLELLENAMRKQEKVIDKLNDSVETLTKALDRFQGGSAALTVGAKVSWAILGGLAATVAFLFNAIHK